MNIFIINIWYCLQVLGGIYLSAIWFFSTLCSRSRLAAVIHLSANAFIQLWCKIPLNDFILICLLSILFLDLQFVSIFNYLTSFCCQHSLCMGVRAPPGHHEVARTQGCTSSFWFDLVEWLCKVGAVLACTLWEYPPLHTSVLSYSRFLVHIQLSEHL